MSACEAVSAAIYTRAVILECLSGDHKRVLKDPQLHKLLPIVAITDCKSVYDTDHREGTIKLPSEKRLGLDVASLKEMLKAEVDVDAPPTKMGTIPILWVPTKHQLADVLTKAMDGSALREAITSGKLTLREPKDGESADEVRCIALTSLSDVCRVFLTNTIER